MVEYHFVFDCHPFLGQVSRQVAQTVPLCPVVSLVKATSLVEQKVLDFKLRDLSGLLS